MILVKKTEICSMKLKHFLFFIVFMSSLTSSAQGLNYYISFPNPNNHLAKVKIDYVSESKSKLHFKLPVWTPGSYLVREFSRNIEQVTVSINGKVEIPQKLDKNTWEISAKKGDRIQLSYFVYCFELSVRTSFIDIDHALLNGASVFMYLEGKEHLSGQIHLEMPKQWKASQSSLNAGNTENSFSYSNYDELVDSPIILGNFEEFSFDVLGIPHIVSMIGLHNANLEVLKKDMQNMCLTMSRIVDEHPCKKYHFIVENVESGGGGLEHKNGSTLMMSRFAYNNSTSYQSFLGLVAHEYFHLWNVKRIRPVALGPFKYDTENYTKSLWIAEGITSYYDELALLRSGLINQQQYLNNLSSTINNQENRFGNKIATLHEMSFDAWIKEYRPNENSKNNSYSYYSKGAIIGALLDMSIQKATNGKRGLDDVMKKLYHDFYKNIKKGPDGIGYTESEFRSICNEVAGVDLSADFNKWLESTESPDYSSIFNAIGIDTKVIQKSKGSWGLNTDLQNGRTIVKYVRNEGTGINLGINVNDEIISLNGVRVNNDLEAVWQKLNTPKEIELIINRNGLIKILKGTYLEFSEFEISLKIPKNSENPEFWKQNGALQHWLRQDKL